MNHVVVASEGYVAPTASAFATSSDCGVSSTTVDAAAAEVAPPGDSARLAEDTTLMSQCAVTTTTTPAAAAAAPGAYEGEEVEEWEQEVFDP